MRFSLLTFSLIFLVACTEKAKEPIRAHAPAVVQPEAKPVAIHEVPENIKPSPESEKWKADAASSKDVLKDILLPLANKVLDPKRIGDKSSYNSRAVMDELITFNSLILQLKPEDRTRPEFKQLITKYQETLELGCGPFADSCTGMKYLKLSSNSAQVVKLMAQLDEGQRYKLLLFAIKMKNSNWDQELIQLLFTDTTKALSQSETQNYETMRSMMGMALQTAADKTATNPADSRAFLESIHAWQLVDSEIRKFDIATQAAVFAMIARSGYMYENESRSTLHPEFKKLVSKMNDAKTGLLAQQKQLEEKKLLSPELIGAQRIDKFDEVYFIIESVFTGQIESANGAQLLAESKRTEKEIITALRNYTRLRFMLALNESTTMAIALFNASVKGEDLVFYYIKESSAIRTVWSTFLSKSLPVHRMAIQTLRKRSSPKAMEKEIDDFFNSSHRSINLSSAYPHTLILFHILSKLNFQLHIPFSSRTFNTGDLMAALFNGKLDPLQSYSDNKQIFNQFELIYAFDMAVRTSLFRLVDVDADFFIADSLRRLNGNSLDTIEKMMTFSRTRLAQMPEFEDFRRACGELKGKFARREFYFTQVRKSPIYGEIITLSLLNIDSGSSESATQTGNLATQRAGFFFADLRFTDAVDRARLDVGNNLRLGRAMLASYTSALKKQGASQEEIEKKTLLTRKVLGEMDGKRKEVLNQAKTWYNELGDCYYKLVNRADQAVVQVVEMEKAYLRQIHRDMKRFRAGTLSDADKARIEAQYKFKGLPSGFTGRDKLSADGLLYTQIDFTVRVARYVTHGLVTEEKNFPALAPHVDIHYGQSLSNDVDDVRNSQVVFLQFVESEDEFVKSGIRAVLNGVDVNADHKKGKFVFWPDFSQEFSTTWPSFIANQAVLYRMEREMTGTNTDFTAERIWRGQEELLELVKLSKGEKDLQTLLMRSYKLHPWSLNRKVAISTDPPLERIVDTLGLYDFPVNLMTLEQHGAYWDGGETDATLKRPGMFDAGKIYYKARSVEARGQSIIPYNSELDDFMDQQVGGFVRGDIQAILDFNRQTKTYIEEVVQKLPVEKRPRADLNISVSITDSFLSDRIVSSFENHVDTFNQSTGNCFASDTKCPSFQQ